MKAAALAVFLLVSCADANRFIQDARERAARSEAAADKALAGLTDLATRRPDLELGVNRVVTQREAARRDVLPIRIVRLDDLVNFTGETDATEVLTESGCAYWRVYYHLPQSAPNRAFLSSVEVRNTPSGWATKRMGGAGYAESVSAAMIAARREPKDVILVQIPALALHFIAFADAKHLMLSSIADAPTFAIREHDPRPAEEVLLKLVFWARRYNGQPN